MRRYKLTGRGWALAVVCAALLFLGTYALVSFASGGDPAEDEPSSPSLTQTTPPEITPPAIPPVTDDPAEPSPSPEQPTPQATPPETTPLPPSSPPPVEPPAEPSAEPSPVPSPVPSPDPSPVPSPAPPKPSQGPPDWAEDSAAIMFGFNSAEMLEPELARNDLADMIPSADELAQAGYIIVITAFTASDEDAEDLAQLRAEAVYEMILGLGVPKSAIRLYADPVSVGTERYRQRVNVYFQEVGNK